ncbi:MAG: CDP-glycerol glycerophosphotransferase family protein [Clostridia bacterium]|nr:CDP-glycerol glycerophosphotransferase family protein [Clostridia bacterium]
MNRNINLLRKTVSSALIRAALQPLKLKKIVPNRVLFSAYMEKQYACNPKYISRELQRLYPGRIEIGWAFREPEKFRYLEKEGIRVLGTGTREFTDFALTSRVICANTYFKPSLPRRRSTFYLYTWHGGGAYKKVGRYVDMPLIEKLNTRMREGKTDLYLSSSSFFTEHVLRDSFSYQGEILEKGMPRNDILLNPPPEEELRRIRARVGLKDGEKLCLYAPTYRKDTKVHDFGLDYERALKALERRFGGQWVMGYRSHHVSMFKDTSQVSRGALDLSLYDDMQELLLVSDALITDYSSSIWDAALGGKRAFLYAPDLNDYLKERAFYTDIRSWPFPLGEDNGELENNILSFDEEQYAAALKRHLEALGSCETGRAASFAARRIAQEMGLEDAHDDQ